jgi:hypothetical protein
MENFMGWAFLLFRNLDSRQMLSKDALRHSVTRSQTVSGELPPFQTLRSFLALVEFRPATKEVNPSHYAPQHDPKTTIIRLRRLYFIPELYPDAAVPCDGTGSGEP